MYKKTLIIIMCLFLTTALGRVDSASAQNLGIRTGSIRIVTNPAFPEPGSTVEAKVEGVLVDISGADISWSVEGSIVKRGKGNNTLSVTAPALGKNLIVQVAVIPSSGGIIQESTTIRSSHIDLIWEADSFVPPFYKGKALRAPQSTARITAFPHYIDGSGKRIPKEDFIYTWKFNEKVMGDSSGYGRYTFFNDISPRENTISVEVSLKNGTLIGRKEVTITNSDPFVALYKDDPLLGINLAYPIEKSYSLKDNEITFVAYPFFMSNQKSSLTYEWRINNKVVETKSAVPHVLTLGRSEDTTGRAVISIVADSPLKAFQRVVKQINLEYQEQWYVT